MMMQSFQSSRQMVLDKLRNWAGGQISTAQADSDVAFCPGTLCYPHETITSLWKDSCLWWVYLMSALDHWTFCWYFILCLNELFPLHAFHMLCTSWFKSLIHAFQSLSSWREPTLEEKSQPHDLCEKHAVVCTGCLWLFQNF